MRSLFVHALLILLLASSGSQAFVLERAESGAAVHWKQNCITWWMEAEGCSQMTPEETQEVLRASFDTWDNFEGMYIDFQEGGVSCTEEVGLDADQAHNVALWHQGRASWPYAARVVGLTTLTFDTESGEIVDADMEFNEEDFRFSYDEQANTYDLQQAVTHEVGHILGLGHSSVPMSVMYETAGPEAWNKRDLHPDDEAGVSANHGLDNAPESPPCADKEPKGTPEAPVCPGEEVSGCSSSGSPKAPLFCVLFCLLWMAGCQRRNVGRKETLIAPLILALILPTSDVAAQLCKPYRIPSGEAIYWTRDAIELSIDSTLPESISAELMQSSVRGALSTWTELECMKIKLSFDEGNEGFSACPGEIIDDEVQCIYWVQSTSDWAFGSGLIAVTLVHHNALSGEIVDTDMAINGTGTFTWSAPELCDIDTPDHDLLATLTHEFGHFFGLDHSSAPQSVMEAATGPGDCDKRTLADFDEACLCDTLIETAPLRETQNTNEEEADVFIERVDDSSVQDAIGSGAEVSDPPRADGCSVSRRPERTHILWALLIMLGAHQAMRRFRRKSLAARVH